jgi:hypothetical protein
MNQCERALFDRLCGRRGKAFVQAHVATIVEIRLYRLDRCVGEVADLVEIGVQSTDGIPANVSNRWTVLPVGAVVFAKSLAVPPLNTPISAISPAICALFFAH